MTHVNSLEYITFIFFEATNGIDFLRRNREYLLRWVVGDIGATIDIKTVMNLSQALRSATADPANRHFGVMIECCGA
jgi:hypothetical protein